MHPKGSRKWFKRVSEEWRRYVGDHATLAEYAAGRAPYLKRLRRDLTEWWGDHEDPAMRLTAEEIEAVARRLAEYLKSYTSPITPPETYAHILPKWLASAPKISSDGSASGIYQMHPLSTRRSDSADDGENDSDDSKNREQHS